MVDKLVLETSAKACGFDTHYPYMKIQKEQRNRKEYVRGSEDRIVEQMIRCLTGKEETNESSGADLRERRKSYRNICQKTGRSRGVVRKYGISRQMFRRKGDEGELEGVRRASW